MDLDLEITNYSISQLEFFFKLEPNYTEEDITLKEDILKNKIIKIKELTEKKKMEIFKFLNEVKTLLIENKKPVIKKENPPIIHTKQEEYVSSELNPIEKRTLTKSLCVDTLFRNNYNATLSTDYIYKLPLPINEVVSLQLTSFEFPNIIYYFSSENNSNTFEIILYNVNTGTTDNSGASIFTTETHTITIPDGNYEATVFKTIINNIFLNTSSIGLKFLKIDINLQMQTVIRTFNIQIDTSGYNPYDNSTSYYSPDFYFKLNFGILNKPLYKTAGWMMGFRKETYINKNNSYISLIDSTIPITYNLYLTSESTYGTKMDNYIFLEIDDYHNNFPTNTFISANTTSYIGKNILARIVLRSGINTIITDNASDGIFKKREYFGPIKLEKFKIRILNKYGEVINLKQNDFSFVLEIKQLY